MSSALRDRRAPDWWLLPSVLAFEVLLFLPSLLQAGLIRGPLPKNNEATSFVYPWQIFWHDEVLAGRWPFWNPFIYGGWPIVGEPQAQTFYPSHLLWLVLAPDVAYKLSFVLQILLGSWFMYRLAQEIGASRFGAAVSALVFGVHGQMMAFVSFGWIHMIAPMTWAPGVIWMLCRTLKDPRRWPGGWIAATGGLLGVQILSGQPEWVRYTLFIGAGVVLGARTLRRSLWERVTIGGVAIAIGLLIGGPQLLPTAQATVESTRGQHALQTSQIARGASLPLLTLPTVIVPGLFGPWDRTITYDGVVHKLTGNADNFGETLVYIGLLPLMLVFLARRDTRPDPRGEEGRAHPALWIAIAVTGLLFALNDWTHVEDVFARVLPLDAAFRSPARFVFLTNFALAILAGFGASRLDRAGYAAVRLATVGVCSAIMLALAGGVLWFARAPLTSIVLAHLHLPASMAGDALVRADGGRSLGEWARAHAAGALALSAGLLVAASLVVRAAPRMATRTRYALVLAVIAVDLGIYAWPLVTNVVRIDDAFRDDFATLAPFARDPDAHIAGARESVFESGDNVTTIARVRSSTGYESMQLADFARVSKAASAGGPDALEAIGITHVVDGDQRGHTSIVTLPDPRGRAWWTDRAVFVRDGDAAAHLLATSAATGIVALEMTEATPASAADQGPPPSPGAATAHITIDEDVPGRFHASVDAPHAGWLVITETFYPGWTARVNGQELAVLRAFGGVQAVRLPEGRADVTLAFRPTVVWWGFAAAALGLVMGVLLTAATRRPR